jgi:formate-dependent phosphoribosylglycinamide formyltransferase (GAR transformylase)
VPSVVFVVPFVAETTMRFVEAAADLEGVRLGIVSQDPVERISARLRAKLVAHRRIPDSLDPRQIAVAVREIGARAGECTRLVGAFEQLQVPLAQVRDALGIEGLGVEAARNFRDKSRMKLVLREAGVPCARHGLASDARAALRVASTIGFPLVAKPPAGAGARNTFRVDGEDDLREYLGVMPPTPAQPLLLEEFVVGEEHSFDAVSIRGEPIWHSLTHYSPGPLEVMRKPWIQWTVLLPREIDHPRYDDIRDVAQRALAALGMGTGLSHMEWFRREDGSIAVSEVGARPPGAQFTTLISYAHGVDFYRAWARLMIEERFDPPERQYAAGIAFLRGQGRGRVRAVHGLAEAQKELGPLVVEVRLPRPGQPQADSYEGEGFVVLRHPETAQVERALRRVVELVRVELA